MQTAVIILAGRGGGSSSVTITNANTVAVGSNLILTAEITPAPTSTPTFTWTITDANATGATITASTFSATAAGTAIIQVAAGSTNGTITATQEISVTTPVTNITISSSGPILVGSSLDLAATVLPTTAAQTLVWSISSGENFATLSGNTLTGIAAGTVTVTATATDGSGITNTQDFGIVVRPTITTTFNAPMATGTPNQVQISWTAITGATGYTLYRTTDNLSNLVDSNPDNLAATTPAAITTNVAGTTTTTVILSGSAKWYFLLTATTNGIESKTNGAQTSATAHPLEFMTVSGNSTATATMWMDRNLGATRVATSAADADGFGGLYQFGRPTDGHQLRGSTPTATLAQTISPGHANFITGVPGDWTTADTNGAQRSAIWSSTDGSGICPTGFRVPTVAELEAEAAAWTPQDPAGAFSSSLKLPTTGYRLNSGGIFAGEFAYQSADVAIISGARFASSLIYSSSVISVSARVFKNGQAIRCIQN